MLVIQVKEGESIEDMKFNIFATILNLRGYRVGMVQTKEQYEFCYQAIAEEY